MDIHNQEPTVTDEEGIIKDLSIDEARIVLRVSNEIFDKLMLKSQHQNFSSLEAYCESLVLSSLITKVGEATISAPAQMSGVQAKKISGPSHSGLISRA